MPALPPWIPIGVASQQASCDQPWPKAFHALPPRIAWPDPAARHP